MEDGSLLFVEIGDVTLLSLLDDDLRTQNAGKEGGVKYCSPVKGGKKGQRLTTFSFHLFEKRRKERGRFSFILFQKIQNNSPESCQGTWCECVALQLGAYLRRRAC